MFSIRKLLFKPKKSDESLLAQFYFADEELNSIALELDGFDGRKEPERCTSLVAQLRQCQDKVLAVLERIMTAELGQQRAQRDFRVKFPDDILQESLSGQLWFGAECLAAGSSIMNREVESASMRPLAKVLTRYLDFLRAQLRERCLRDSSSLTDKLQQMMVVFDGLFAEFELSYVSAMVPVKTMKEYEMMQDVIVLFCETTARALKLHYLTQDMIEDCDPALMFTIPRLAIVGGLLVFPEGPLNPDLDPASMSEMFRPFQTLLYKIRGLLCTLSQEELTTLENLLCNQEAKNEQPLESDKANLRNALLSSQPPVISSLDSAPSKLVIEQQSATNLAPQPELPATQNSIAKSSSLHVPPALHHSHSWPAVAVGDCIPGGEAIHRGSVHHFDFHLPMNTSQMVESSFASEELTAARLAVAADTDDSTVESHSLRAYQDLERHAASLSSSSTTRVQQLLFSDGAATIVAGQPLLWEPTSCDTSDSISDLSDTSLLPEEEIGLAIQAAENAQRAQARARFKSSSDLIHRLFVCISGVADQLQTNSAGDLRNVLKTVFECYTLKEETRDFTSDLPADAEDEPSRCADDHEEPASGTVDLGEPSQSTVDLDEPPAEESSEVEEAPEWLPDDQSMQCMACRLTFTFVRRRHHCRNCGKLFCGRCSSNSVPLPQFGHAKPVRVCNQCFMFNVTHFTAGN